MFIRDPNFRKILKIGCTGFVVSSLGWTLYHTELGNQIQKNGFNLSTFYKILDERKTTNKNLVSNYIDLKLLSKQTAKALWESLKFKFAKQLVKFCKSENAYIQKNALNMLGNFNSLDDNYFRLLSNIIDEEIAVYLARIKNVDPRFFKQPSIKYSQYNENDVVHELKEILLQLSSITNHNCLEYFLSKAFFNVEDLSKVVDADTAMVEMVKIKQNGQDLLFVCLDYLLHHASIECFGQDIANMKILPLLISIYYNNENDLHMNITLCKLISYLSFHREILEELHSAGWIGVLAKWVKHDDVRLSLPAVRALANFDRNTKCYKKHLYLLHPTFIDKVEPEVDVIFVHGLLGGVFYTWRQRKKCDTIKCIEESKKGSILDWFSFTKSWKRPQNITEISEPNVRQYVENFEESNLAEIKDFEIVLEDIPIHGDSVGTCNCTCNVNSTTEMDETDTRCWPRDWLSKDCDNLRIIGVDYDTTLSKWNAYCPYISEKTNLAEQTLKLLNNLLEAGVGKRPVIWITHSMGGLLVKNILCKSFYSTNETERQLVENTKAVVFYSTPHLGSSLASFNPASRFILRLSIEVQELRKNSPILKEMHSKFLQILETVPIKVITFVETKQTVFSAFKFSYKLVSRESGKTGVGEYYEIPLDHLNMCKPSSRFSFLYRKIVDLVKTTVDSSKEN